MSVRLNCLCYLSLLLSACNSSARIDHTEGKVYALGTSGFTTEDSVIYHTLQPYKLELDGKMDVVLAVSEQVLEKGQPEGLLGNFVADLSLEMANRHYHPTDGHRADFCFLNNGGLRAALPKGPLSKRKIFEVMPFENELIIVPLKGNVVRQLVDFIAAKGGMPVSGIRLKIKEQRATDVTIGQMPLDTLKTYKVATSDYLANGGDNLSFLAAATGKESTGLKIRDAIIQFLEEKSSRNESIRVTTDQRITHAR